MNDLISIDAEILEGRKWGEGTTYSYVERHGRWLNKKYKYIKSISMSAVCECSACGEVGIKDWNYCPHCGALMMEGKQNE